MVATLTGPGAEFGQLGTSSCYAAVPLINKAGGILGHKAKCYLIDDYGDPADAVPAVEKAIATASNLAMEIGPETSTAATVIPLLEKADIPTFSVNGLIAYDHQTNPYFYRMAPSDPQNGAAYVVAAKEDGFHKIAIIYQNDIDASGNYTGTVDAVHKLGMKVTNNISLPGDQSSYSSVVERVIAAKPQAMILYGDPQTTATFLSNYKQLNSGKIPPMITASSSTTPDFFSAVKKAAGLAYTTKDILQVGPTRDLTGPAFKIWKSALLSAPHVKSAQTILAAGDPAAQYDAINLMALAMDEAHSIKGPDYNKDILKVANGGPGAVVVHDYAQGLSALKAGKQIHYVGTSGPIHFDKYHNFVGAWGEIRFTASGSGTPPFHIIPQGKVLPLA